LIACGDPWQGEVADPHWVQPEVQPEDLECIPCIEGGFVWVNGKCHKECSMDTSCCAKSNFQGKSAAETCALAADDDGSSNLWGTDHSAAKSCSETTESSELSELTDRLLEHCVSTA